MGPNTKLPASDSPQLCLHQPTPEECIQIWSKTAAAWKDSLTVPLYILEAQYLTTVPLARNRGMTTWVLADASLPANHRPLLCSSESFRKRALASDAHGNVKECVVHGIASVFCPAEFRGRGYGSRHMRELAAALRRGWQGEGRGASVGCVLYSDIGKRYYARLGWRPHPRNAHFAFPPAQGGVAEETPARARAQVVAERDLGALCSRDEAMVHAAMATPCSATARRRVVVLPDLEHMLWHIRKADFATAYIFGKIPAAKGAAAGSAPGKQVWAIWTHRYYGHPDHVDEAVEGVGEAGGNVLYILRLVVEGDGTANRPREEGRLPPLPMTEKETEEYTERKEALEAVLRAAQSEAAEWRLDSVKLWEPSPLVERMIEESGIEGVEWVEREEESIASALWFEEGGEGEDGGGGGDGDDGEGVVWVNNEHYAWC